MGKKIILMMTALLAVVVCVVCVFRYKDRYGVGEEKQTAYPYQNDETIEPNKLFIVKATDTVTTTNETTTTSVTTCYEPYVVSVVYNITTVSETKTTTATSTETTYNPVVQEVTTTSYQSIGVDENSYETNDPSYNSPYEPTQTEPVYMADGTEKWVSNDYYWSHLYEDNYIYDRNNGYWYQAPYTDTWYSCYSGVTYTEEYESLYNIDLACQYLNNQVLQAHSEFVWSDWERMGPNDETQGYLSGAVIIDGYVPEPGEPYPTAPGGGVCVVSSVLFNAALDAGCVPLENHDHIKGGVPVDMSYAPVGRQASVSYGSWDCIFFNPSDRDLKISAYFDWTTQSCTVEMTPLN